MMEEQRAVKKRDDSIVFTLCVIKSSSIVYLFVLTELTLFVIFHGFPAAIFIMVIMLAPWTIKSFWSGQSERASTRFTLSLNLKQHLHANSVISIKSYSGAVVKNQSFFWHLTIHHFLKVWFLPVPLTSCVSRIRTNSNILSMADKPPSLSP